MDKLYDIANTNMELVPNRASHCIEELENLVLNKFYHLFLQCSFQTL